MKTIKSVDNLFSVVLLKPLRKTTGVAFDLIPYDILKKADSVDRVIHNSSAISPGRTEAVDCPWYMHPHQEDNLLVLNGTRHIDLYTAAHGKIETFIVTPYHILQNGKFLIKEPAMLIWPRKVFHRVRSDKEGSASVNFAVHNKGFDIKTNFNIYDLNTATGEYHVLRQGYMDQF